MTSNLPRADLAKKLRAAALVLEAWLEAHPEPLDDDEAAQLEAATRQIQDGLALLRDRRPRPDR